MKILWLAFLMALALLAGCSKPESPLRVGLLVWPAYELPYLARELGYFDSSRIQLIDFYSPAEVMHAYTSGSLDAIAVTTDYALQLVTQDPDQRIIMVIDTSYGGDALLAIPGIESLDALRSKRIGVERSALGAFILRRALDHSQLEKGDITIVSVDVEDSLEAYQSGRVDAVITYEPYRSQILALGAREIFSSRNIPGEVVDILLSRQEIIDGNEEAFETLISGWLRAGEDFETRATALAENMAKREQLTIEEFLKALDGIRLADRSENRLMLTGETPAMREVLRRQLDILVDENLVQPAPHYADLIDGRFFDN